MDWTRAAREEKVENNPTFLESQKYHLWSLEKRERRMGRVDQDFSIVHAMLEKTISSKGDGGVHS